MSLPMTPSNQPDPPDVTVQNQDESPATKETHSILVVDDDHNLRQSLRRQLVAAGVDVLTAG